MTNNKKIVLIGCGMIGQAFVYDAIISGIAKELVLIDINQKVVNAVKLDMEDAIVASNDDSIQIKVGTYSDCNNADVIIITSGFPNKVGDVNRQVLLEKNISIIREIATEVSKTNFSGLTIISSNPCEALTHEYQKVTKFPTNRVISSGTQLDTNRFKVFFKERFPKVPINDFPCYILGKHDPNCYYYIDKAKWTKLNLPWDEKLFEEGLEVVKGKAFQIIDNKGFTNYGIGAALVFLCKIYFQNTPKEVIVGVYNKEKNEYMCEIAKLSSKGIQ